MTHPQITARDSRGVVVTIIADNYFGYCKKETKTQLGYASNAENGTPSIAAQNSSCCSTPNAFVLRWDNRVYSFYALPLHNSECKFFQLQVVLRVILQVEGDMPPELF